MEDKKPQSEPLRRLITPQQLGLVAFFILFWALALHYTLDRFWQTQDDCPVIVEQSSTSVRDLKGCVEEE